MYDENVMPLPGYTDEAFSRLRYDIDRNDDENYPLVDEIRDQNKARRANCRRPFPKISLDKFPNWQPRLERRLTGIDSDKSSNPPIMDLSKNDLCIFDSTQSRVQITLDVDSVVSIFHRLDAIQAEINFHIYSNMLYSLKTGLNIFYEGIPIHKMCGWHFGVFAAENMKFDLYLLLPRLSPVVGKINYAPHKVQQFFYDKIFLKAIRDVVPTIDPQYDFPITWEQEKHLCEAVRDNKVMPREYNHRQLDRTYPVAPDHLKNLWFRMDELLKEILNGENDDECLKKAKELEGMIFCVDAKNLKKKLFTLSANMKNLHKVLRHKVSGLYYMLISLAISTV